MRATWASDCSSPRGASCTRWSGARGLERALVPRACGDRAVGCCCGVPDKRRDWFLLTGQGIRTNDPQIAEALSGNSRVQPHAILLTAGRLTPRIRKLAPGNRNLVRRANPDTWHIHVNRNAVVMYLRIRDLHPDGTGHVREGRKVFQPQSGSAIRACDRIRNEDVPSGFDTDAATLVVSRYDPQHLDVLRPRVPGARQPDAFSCIRVIHAAQDLNVACGHGRIAVDRSVHRDEEAGTSVVVRQAIAYGDSIRAGDRDTGLADSSRRVSGLQGVEPEISTALRNTPTL